MNPVETQIVSTWIKNSKAIYDLKSPSYFESDLDALLRYEEMNPTGENRDNHERVGWKTHFTSSTHTSTRPYRCFTLSAH